jgi:hypothetical protein
LGAIEPVELDRRGFDPIDADDFSFFFFLRFLISERSDNVFPSSASSKCDGGNNEKADKFL